jgi:Ca2+-binding EF-hand superfamily protein
LPSEFINQSIEDFSLNCVVSFIAFENKAKAEYKQALEMYDVKADDNMDIEQLKNIYEKAKKRGFKNGR